MFENSQVHDEDDLLWYWDDDQDLETLPSAAFVWAIIDREDGSLEELKVYGDTLPLFEIWTVRENMAEVLYTPLPTRLSRPLNLE